MPTTGAIITGTGASMAGIGTVAWATATNITSSNDARATCPTTDAVSLWLRATNFNFSTIPDNAFITGLTATVEASYASGTGSTITAATLIVGNAVAGTLKTLALALTTTDALYTIGSVVDMWGYELTPALLKTSTTGFAVSFTGVGAASSRVDAMYLTVEYVDIAPLNWNYIRRKKRVLANARLRGEP